DAMLQVSGILDRGRSAAHPFPPMEQWRWTQHSPFKAVFPSNHRSIYLMTQRLQRHPYLALFDGPDTNTTTGRRAASTVPQQPLFFLNTLFMPVQAEACARRIMDATGHVHERIQLAHALAWSRTPGPAEMTRTLAYLQACTEELAHAGLSGSRLEME